MIFSLAIFWQVNRISDKKSQLRFVKFYKSCSPVGCLTDFFFGSSKVWIFLSIVVVEWSQGFLLAIKHAGLHHNYKVVTIETFIQQSHNMLNSSNTCFLLVAPLCSDHRQKLSNLQLRYKGVEKLIGQLAFLGDGSSWSETTNELETKKTLYNQPPWRWNPVCLLKHTNYIDFFGDNSLSTRLSSNLKPS